MNCSFFFQQKQKSVQQGPVKEDFSAQRKFRKAKDLVYPRHLSRVGWEKVQVMKRALRGARKYLTSKPMISEDLFLKSFKSKRTGLSTNVTMEKLAAILGKIL